MYQAGMISAITDGDKSLIYLEQTANYVADDSLQEYVKEGAVSTLPENGEDSSGSKCGTYVYNLWNSADQECFPHLKNSLGEYISNDLNDKLAASEDINLRKKTNYEYFYESSIDGSTLSALSPDRYTYYVYKGIEYEQRDDVKQYVEQQQQFGDLKFSGNFIWPVPGYYSVSSCFGYRGNVAKGATTYHGGLDISAPKGTPVYSTASGTVSTIQTSWNAIIIDHGGGLKSTYGHLSKIDVKIGDMVNQNQKIGEVGDTAAPGRFHLHFSISSDNVNPTLNQDGAPAVIIDKSNYRLINPTCFLNDVIKSNNVQFNMQSQSCKTELKDKQGNVVDATAGGPFKFCDLYGSITPTNVNCQKKENTDWKITNIQASDKEVSGEKTITILTTIENSGDECASIAGRPKISASDQNDYVVDGEKKYDVYKDNQGNIYRNVETKCTFITDKNKLTTERGPDKCVLLAPTDDSKMKYTVTAKAIDANGRLEPSSKTVTFEVTTPQVVGTGGTGGQVAVPPIQLTESQKRNIETTKKNVEDAKILQYIIDTANKEKVSPEVVLGLVTQESKGNINAISPTGATGLFQVIRSYHEARVKSECSSWDNFKTDAQCQVRVGIGILKQYYQQYAKKGLPMKCACEGNKGTSNCKPIDTTYTEWDAALRAYNNAGCAVWADYNFVETVMTYASGWGYSGTILQVEQYQQVSIDEIEGKGIIGKYYVNPSFKVDIPFDLSLVDNLSRFMNQTVNECRISPLGKEPCLDSKIVEFNNDVGSYYKANGIRVELSRDCDDDPDEKKFNEFIESVEDCALSADFDCQCTLKESSSLKINIEADEDSAAFTYTKSGINYEVDSYNKFIDSNNAALKLTSPINAISLYKKDGYLKSGTTAYRSCSIPESRFRLCLKTDYQTSEYDGRTLSEKNVTLKFAITIKDNDAPPPIMGLELMDMKHARNNVIVSWDESKDINGVRVPDVGSYVIYMSDVAIDFNNDIRTIRNNVHYRTLDILNTFYDKVQGLDLTKEPECEIVDNKYCIFKYDAKDINGADIKIELLPDKLYFMTDTKKFFYILNGSDSYNMLNSGRDKYIAVTAVDTDGNEIDNVNTTQKITLGQNLQNIKPIDNLEPGFVQLNAIVNPLTNKISLSYNTPEFYINGEAMDNVAILYRAYVDWNTCGQNGNSADFCDVKIPFNHVAETGDLTMDVDKTMVYRIGVIPMIQKSNIDAEYISAFTQTIIGP
jgi:murein DD-endopeptidase MepM/ murein hydrolase activator NlpD